MENDSNIEFFTDEQIKEMKASSKMTYKTPLIIFLLVVGVFSVLSYFSINEVLKCSAEAKKEAAISADFYSKIDPKINSDLMQGGTEQLLLRQCVKNNFFASNAINVLAVSLNFIGIFLLTLLYFVIFKKNHGSMKFGKAVIIAIILSFMSLLSLLLGIIGSIIALIIGTWMVMKILGTDMFGALIFIVTVGLLNWVVFNIIAKLLA